MDGYISATVTRVQSQQLAYRDNGFNFPPLDFSKQPWPTRTRLAYEGEAYETVYYVISLDFTLIIWYNHRGSFKNLLIPISLHHRPESWSLATKCQSCREFTPCHFEHWFVVADRAGAWKSKVPQTARHHFLSGAPVVSFSGRVARLLPKSDSQNRKTGHLCPQ